ncbi:MAG: hypothetical protein JXP34_23980 [Planctomycetes bacterium]|nr:hypothetical protein [Planctomycetota bacterium]
MPRFAKSLQERASLYINELEVDYGSLGEIVNFWQEHDGAVDRQSQPPTPKVSYTYEGPAGPSADHIVLRGGSYYEEATEIYIAAGLDLDRQVGTALQDEAPQCLRVV